MVDLLENELLSPMLMDWFLLGEQFLAPETFQRITQSVTPQPPADLQGLIGDCSCFLLLLSPQAYGREGYLQREIRLALDRMLDLPPGSVFVVPVLLEDFEPVDVRVGHFRSTSIWSQPTPR